VLYSDYLIPWSFHYAYLGHSTMKNLFTQSKPIIAVVYLPPLPGYPDHPGLFETLELVYQQVSILEKHQIAGVLLENENDRPYRLLATPEIIASMTYITSKVVEKFKHIKVGVEYLLNDPKASLAIAHVSGAQFIRTDYFVDRMSREEYGGEMYINPVELINYRMKLSATNLKIFTDIQVKYAKMLDPKKSLSDSAKQARSHHSSAVVISGNETGIAPDLSELKKLKENIADFPILIGSGLNPSNAKQLFRYADGAIVGTSLMHEGIIIEEKVRALRSSL